MALDPQLAEFLSRDDIPFRGLARDLRPDKPEPMRRLLRRYAKGERSPSPEMRAEIVVALERRGFDVDELKAA